MREIVLIGIGVGHPDHITLEGVSALQQADLVLLPLKTSEKADLADFRKGLLARHAADVPIQSFAMPVRNADDPSYLKGVADWHEAIAAHYRKLIAATRENARIALLVWGDPSLYDSTLRILDRVRETGVGFTTRVVPGITAIQALAAAFALPLNRLGAPVLITTGRQLAQGWPGDVDTIVVMLDGRQAFTQLSGAGLEIFWGAYLGSPDQILVSGPLDKVCGKIVAIRTEARERHGWIMDTYLLRRP